MEHQVLMSSVAPWYSSNSSWLAERKNLETAQGFATCSIKSTKTIVLPHIPMISTNSRMKLYVSIGLIYCILELWMSIFQCLSNWFLYSELILNPNCGTKQYIN